MPLQIRRGTELQRQTMTVPLASGELLYVTDDQRLYVGNGATLGGVQITGYTNEDAVDAVGAALTAGVHTNITFTYSSTQDAAGRIDATVDLSGYQGTISASAFKGSLVADDSTILVDGVNGQLVGPLATSGLASNLNLNGFGISSLSGSNLNLNVSSGGIVTVTGGIQVDNFIRSATSTLSLESTGFVSIAGTAASPDGNFIITRNSYTSSTLSGFIFEQYHSNTDVVNLTLFRGRGTSAAPLAVQNGDDIADVVFAAVSSAGGPVAGAVISVIVDGIPSGGNVPSRISFATNNGTALASRAQLTPQGVWRIDQLSSLNTNFIEVQSLLKGDLTGSVFADDSSVIIDATEGGKITSPSVSISEFLQLPVFADDAARLASIPTPAKGMVIMIESGTTPVASNQLQFFDGTNWVTL